MILGKGLIAQSLCSIDEDNAVFFASGVSNSLETNPSEFQREIDLLKTTLSLYPNKKLVYFSTLSISDQSKQQSPYVIHKKEIERYIEENCAQYLILRIGNIIGKGGNPNTLFNFLRHKINTQEPFLVHKNARRLLIDIEDIQAFISENQNYQQQYIVNLAYPYPYSMEEIIGVMEEMTHKKALYDIVEEGDCYSVDFCENIKNYFASISPMDYLIKMTKKYI